MQNGNVKLLFQKLRFARWWQQYINKSMVFFWVWDPVWLHSLLPNKASSVCDIAAFWNPRRFFAPPHIVSALYSMTSENAQVWSLNSVSISGGEKDNAKKERNRTPLPAATTAYHHMNFPPVSCRRSTRTVIHTGIRGRHLGRAPPCISHLWCSFQSCQPRKAQLKTSGK